MDALNFYFIGELQEVSQYTQNSTQTEGPGQEPRPLNSVLFLCHHTVSACCVLCHETFPI